MLLTMVDKLREKLGESNVEKSSAVWKEFTNIKQKEDEIMKDYVARFEQTETKMKNADMRMPDKVLALHIMMKSNMEPQSKENILTKTNLTNNEQMYTSMKKAMKEMKSNITVDEENKEEEENKTFHGYGNRYGESRNYRGRSKERNGWEKRSNYSRSRSQGRY